jgi:hypothetical protein
VEDGTGDMDIRRGGGGGGRENANTAALQKHCTGAPPAKRDISLLKGMSTCKHTNHNSMINLIVRIYLN